MAGKILDLPSEARCLECDAPLTAQQRYWCSALHEKRFLQREYTRKFRELNPRVAREHDARAALKRDLNCGKVMPFVVVDQRTDELWVAPCARYEKLREVSRDTLPDETEFFPLPLPMIQAARQLIGYYKQPPEIVKAFRATDQHTYRDFPSVGEILLAGDYALFGILPWVTWWKASTLHEAVIFSWFPSSAAEEWRNERPLPAGTDPLKVENFSAKRWRPKQEPNSSRMWDNFKTINESLSQKKPVDWKALNARPRGPQRGPGYRFFEALVINNVHRLRERYQPVLEELKHSDAIEWSRHPFSDPPENVNFQLAPLPKFPRSKVRISPAELPFVTPGKTARPARKSNTTGGVTIRRAGAADPRIEPMSGNGWLKSIK